MSTVPTMIAGRLGSFLIDHRPPVDDVDQAPWQRRALRAGNQPQRHHRRLAEPGRCVDRSRQCAALEVLLEETPLPRQRAIPGQQFEGLLKRHADLSFPCRAAKNAQGPGAQHEHDRASGQSDDSSRSGP
jgi:hypothetical protein